jgi:hypothetical protein
LPWNRIDGNSRYVIENCRKALDAPGEWLLENDGYLYYIPLPGETPETLECTVPVTERFITLKGDREQPVEHICFENLRFEVSGYLMPPGGNEPVQAAAPIEASVMADFASHIEFLNCDIAHTGLHAIWFREQCTQSKIIHCHLYEPALRKGEHHPQQYFCFQQTLATAIDKSGKASFAVVYERHYLFPRRGANEI